VTKSDAFVITLLSTLPSATTNPVGTSLMRGSLFAMVSGSFRRSRRGLLEGGAGFTPGAGLLTAHYTLRDVLFLEGDTVKRIGIGGQTGNWGTGTFPLSEKIIAATQRFHNVVETSRLSTGPRP
jgi:hypothetical protein